MIRIDRGRGDTTSSYIVNSIFLNRNGKVPMKMNRIRRDVLQSRPRQQRVRFAKPHPLPPTLVARHRATLIQNFLRPLPRFFHAPLRVQEKRVVVVSLRTGGNLRRLLKQRLSFFRLPGLRVSMSQQAFGAMEIVVSVGGNGALE